MQVTRRRALGSLGAFLSLSVVPGARVLRRRRDPAELLAAVRAGDVDRVRRLLTAEPALARARDERGRSAHVLAWVHGHPEVAEVLQEAGLELDAVEAVLAEDWERFGELVEARPELVHAAHPIGGTPLHAAALSGTHGMWRLRGAGCAPDAAPAGGSGFTPARTALEAARAAWARIALTDLCANGADVNAAQPEGSSVLHAAVERRDEVLVRLAIRKGADVAAVDAAGRTPRALADELGWRAGVDLLDGHAKLPRDDRSSRFALDANREPVRRADLSDVPRERQGEVTGNSHANLPRVRELLAADPRLTWSISTDDELAIEACAHVGSRDIIRLHLDHGAPLSLPTAVSLGDLESVAFWLEREPGLVHERGAHDFPVMWYALLGGGGVETAELLAHLGVPVDQESMGTTTLHWCARRDDADLARWLLENGADAEALGLAWTREPETPLQVATREGSERVAGVLRDAGARR